VANHPEKINYKKAGVDTHKAQKLIADLKKDITSTHKNLKTGQVRNNYGGFAGLFKPENKYRGFDIVASTDGVGTKIELCKNFNYFEGLGFDLVAMCVNDLYCAGAVPFFFLDYLACGKLDDSWYVPVISSIAKACKSVPMALLGGETAEHPGIMKNNDFDLAGFCVGAVDSKNALPKTNKMKQGDLLVALPSSGFHSNGFSLIRKVLEKMKKNNSKNYLKLTSDRNFITKTLLTPTRIYSFLPELISKIPVKGIAHITGGGIYENLPRILPNNLKAFIEKPLLFKQKNYDFLNDYVNVKDLFSTFNMGMGIIIVVERSKAALINKFDSKASVIGYLIENKDKSKKNIILEGIDT